MFVRVGAGPCDPDLLAARSCALLRSADVVVAQNVDLVALARSFVSPSAQIHLAAEWFTDAANLTQRCIVHLVSGDGLAPTPPGQPLPDDIVPGPAADAAERVLTQLADVGEARPLRGRTIVVTRAAEQAGGLAAPLRRLGAAVVELPTISIGAALDGGAALGAALAEVERYAWLVLTSVNGAQRVLERLADGRRLSGVSIAAIGPATAEALAVAHLPADLVPPRFVAESLLEVFPSPDAATRTRRVLLARAAVARDVLPRGLRSLGWEVDVVEAYRTTTPALDPVQRDAAARADMVCFTAPSTFTRYVELVGQQGIAPIVACIGPVTAAAVRSAGLEVQIEATEHTMAGLVAAVLEWVGSLDG